MQGHAVRGAASILSPLHTPCSWLTPCGRIAFALWEPCSVSEQVIHSFIHSFFCLFVCLLSHSVTVTYSINVYYVSATCQALLSSVPWALGK